MFRFTSLILSTGFATSLMAQSFTVNVKIENLASTGGLYLTPVFTGFHDGGYDLFNSGEAASGALESIAEVGDTSGLIGLLGSTQASSVADMIGGAPFGPGSSLEAQFTLDVMDNRYLSFATMVVPSNDTFLGNGDPMALELFDGAGNFTPISLTLTGEMAYDAGTELNSLTTGPAFVVGQVGTDGTAEGGVVALQPTDGLDEFIGANTPGGTISSALSSSNLFRISVTAIPEPGMVGPLLGLAALGFVVRRRR
jgi:hypothetical protein